MYIRRSPPSAPIATLYHSIRANESVSMRAITGGMTSAAATSVTPRTFIVATIAAASTSENSASIRAVLTPDASATSGSNVVNSNCR